MSASSSALIAFILSLSVTNEDPEAKLLFLSEDNLFVKYSFSPGVCPLLYQGVITSWKKIFSGVIMS